MSPGSPRTLTTSPQMALFHRFLARWSAFWVPRPSGRPLDGGNCTTRGCDTPATHRQRASCSAKPPPPPSWSAPAGPEGPAPVPMSGKSPATGPKGGPLPVQNSPSTPPRTACAVQNSPRTSRTAYFRYKTLPARAARPHFRYKTLPARAARPYFRYKTLPARPKWLDLALFRHAGRVLYRCRHQEAKQGEFCTEREAETGLANTTAHQAPRVRRAPEGPEGVAARRAWPQHPESDGDNHPSKSRT